MEVASNSTEIWVLGWSVVLLLVQIVLQASLTARDAGPSYAAGNHLDPAALSPLGTRVKNALANLLETYPAFVALALGLAVTGKTGGWAATGALIWLLARVLYALVYAAGIPGIRTAAWLASIAGLAMMLWRLMVL